MKTQTKSQAVNKDSIILFLRKNKKKLKNEFGVTKIALFGSYAKNKQKKNSDIDLLIEMKHKDFKQRIHLIEFLEISFKKKVEIGYFDTNPEFVKHHIQKDLVYA